MVDEEAPVAITHTGCTVQHSTIAIDMGHEQENFATHREDRAEREALVVLLAVRISHSHACLCRRRPLPACLPLIGFFV